MRRRLWVVLSLALAVVAWHAPAMAFHDADFKIQDWKIELSELLRVIQLYNCGKYHEELGTEDGFDCGPSPSSRLAFYSFDNGLNDEVGKNGPFHFANVDLTTTPGTPYFNGVYDQNPSGPDPSPGYRALVQLPTLDYHGFEVRLQFSLEELGTTRTPLTMSRDYRWIIVHIEPTGALSLHLNNYRTSFYDISLPAVAAGQWYGLSVSYDHVAKQVCLGLDEGAKDCRTLPPDFEWSPLAASNPMCWNADTQTNETGAAAVECAKQLTFTNYSSGIAFKGWVDNVEVWPYSLGGGGPQ